MKGAAGPIITPGRIGLAPIPLDVATDHVRQVQPAAQVLDKGWRKGTHSRGLARKLSFDEA
jgi:hypothetical protein